MSNLVFYTNPQSRSVIAHWMLEELGEPYETVWLEYLTSMKSPEFLQINPLGKVPALTHNGAVITETAAICAYLATSSPEKQLMPSPDSAQLGNYFRWLFFASGPFEMAITVKSMQWPVKEENTRSLGFGTFDAALDVLESALSPGPYICGAQFTAADVYVGSHLDFAMQFGNLDKRASFESYVDSLKERPAYQRTQEICQQQVQQTDSQE